jgi:murein DD-endopeptidase MepM/ murein hydrolase activator NlpD
MALNKIALVVGILAILGIGIGFVMAKSKPGPSSSNMNSVTTATSNTPSTVPTNQAVANKSPLVVLPISNFYARVTNKRFGQYITPQNSPVQPEHFQGYHTGVDAESTPAEQNIDVSVFSVADGTVVYRGYVSGYGGVVIVQINIDHQNLLAIYGHVRLSSVSVKRSSHVTAGQQLAVLGTGYSTEAAGERKHLHFALLKGSTINFRGYVQQSSELAHWLDPITWLQSHQAN